ncbi:hypothetical protein, partial [Nonlabens ulvanivorans]
KNVFNQIEQYQFDTELLESTFNQSGSLTNLVFRIDDESFVFNVLDSNSFILIDIDERNNRVNVSKKEN